MYAGLTVATEADGDSERKSIQTNYMGLPITIEFEKGDYKDGFYQRAPYGYINNTGSMEEGEELDVFLGPDPTSEKVFLVSMMDPEDNDSFMEHKALLGFTDHDEAQEFFCNQYFEGMCGPIIETSIQDLKEWCSIQRTKVEKTDNALELGLIVPMNEESSELPLQMND